MPLFFFRAAGSDWRDSVEVAAVSEIPGMLNINTVWQHRTVGSGWRVPVHYLRHLALGSAVPLTVTARFFVFVFEVNAHPRPPPLLPPPLHTDV